MDAGPSDGAFPAPPKYPFSRVEHVARGVLLFRTGGDPTMKTMRVLTTLAVAAGLGGCEVDRSGTGTVRGRVVDVTGQPISGARVAVDRLGGRSTVTNARGEFRIAAKDGQRTLLAFSVALDAGASTQVAVTDGDVVDAGDVTLVDCTVLAEAAPGGAPAPDEDGMMPSDGSDPSMPCLYEPPPPPAEHVSIASLAGDFASGFVDPWGVSGYADDSSAQAGFDFWIAADVAAGGAFSGHVVNDYTNGIVEAHVGLFTYGDATGWGHYYLLREGDVSVTVTDDGDGDPSTLAFTFSGSNLVFEYAGWNGIDGGYTADVGAATASGDAWQWIPPSPPAEDVTLGTFVADWKYLSLCPACATDGGDAIYVYAWDGANQADLSLSLPVSALALGGSAEVSGANEVFGWASVYTDGGGWGYELGHLTASAGETLASGELFALAISDAQFDYVDAYTALPPVTAEDGETTPGGDGGTPSEPPPVSEFQLFIGSGDLSAVVDDYGCVEPQPADGGID